VGEPDRRFVPEGMNRIPRFVFVWRWAFCDRRRRLPAGRGRRRGSGGWERAEGFCRGVRRAESVRRAASGRCRSSSRQAIPRPSSGSRAAPRAGDRQRSKWLEVLGRRGGRGNLRTPKAEIIGPWSIQPRAPGTVVQLAREGRRGADAGRPPDPRHCRPRAADGIAVLLSGCPRR
jgi:hypothetical protein